MISSKIDPHWCTHLIQKGPEVLAETCTIRMQNMRGARHYEGYKQLEYFSNLNQDLNISVQIDVSDNNINKTSADCRKKLIDSILLFVNKYSFLHGIDLNIDDITKADLDFMKLLKSEMNKNKTLLLSGTFSHIGNGKQGSINTNI